MKGLSNREATVPEDTVVIINFFLIIRKALIPFECCHLSHFLFRQFKIPDVIILDDMLLVR